MRRLRGPVDTLLFLSVRRLIRRTAFHPLENLPTRLLGALFGKGRFGFFPGEETRPAFGLFLSLPRLFLFPLLFLQALLAAMEL